MRGEPSPKAIDVDGLAWRGQRLRHDAAAAELFAQFGHAGVRALLLKGRAISGWLYGQNEERRQMDCDLLVAPADLIKAEEILRSLGYGRHWDDRGMPSWWREHAGEWLRDRDGAVIDVHRTLAGVGVHAEAAWRTLSRDTETVTVAGREVPVLGLPARALHVALHAAHHGKGPQPPLEDLRRALRTVDDSVWRGAAELARELSAVDAFTSGLQLDPDGAGLVRRLGLPSRVSTEAALKASSPPPVALGFEQLAHAHGIRAKLVIVARKLVPPADFIRHWDPQAERSRSALLRAYVRRPLWLLSRAPRGFRAWSRARGSGRD